MIGREGARIDWIVKQDPWYLNLSTTRRAIIDMILNMMHHWWMGLLLVLYTPWVETQWFGWGLASNDIPDIPTRIVVKYGYLVGKVKEKITKKVVVMTGNLDATG
jgi:TRAP-type mannitol/chloroaromatic compound transport system permease small subunit